MEHIGASILELAHVVTLIFVRDACLLFDFLDEIALGEEARGLLFCWLLVADESFGVFSLFAGAAFVVVWVGIVRRALDKILVHVLGRR